MSDEPFTIESIEGRFEKHAIVVIGGHPPDRRVIGALPAAPTVICADSGLDHALRLGLEPSVVIGDMDSVDPSSLLSLRTSSCEILDYPSDKDLTDTELALAHVVDRGFRQVTLVWGGGDRIDHILGVVCALGHPLLGSLDRVSAWVAADRIDVVHAGREITLDHEPNSILSLVAIGAGDAIVTTRGLKWDLDCGILTGDRARGLSNVVQSTPIWISCHSGVTAVITPDRLAVLEGKKCS